MCKYNNETPPLPLERPRGQWCCYPEHPREAPLVQVAACPCLVCHSRSLCKFPLDTGPELPVTQQEAAETEQRLETLTLYHTHGKEPAGQCRRRKRCGLDPWVRKIPWRRKWQPTPVFFLPGESHGPRSLAGYSLKCRRESDTTEHSQHCRRGKLKLGSENVFLEAPRRVCDAVLAAVSSCLSATAFSSLRPLFFSHQESASILPLLLKAQAHCSPFVPFQAPW